MKTVQVTLEKYEEPVTFVAEDSPIVNDPDYIEVITTAPTIHYSYDGIECAITGDKKDTLTDLIKKVKSSVAWDKWFHDNADGHDFKDYGLNSPRVYDHEEDDFFTIRNIGNYVNNCFHDEEVMLELHQIAEEEIKVEIKHDITFEVYYQEENISGYLPLDYADDDTPLLFYEGINYSDNYPSNPYHENSKDWKKWNDFEYLKEVFQTTDIIQHLVDFAFEEKTVIIGEDAQGNEVRMLINSGD